MLWIQIIGWAGLFIAWTWAWLTIVQHFESKNKEKS